MFLIVRCANSKDEEEYISANKLLAQEREKFTARNVNLKLDMIIKAYACSMNARHLLIQLKNMIEIL